MMKLAIACTLGLLMHALPAHGADTVRTEELKLAPSGSATLKGKIKGRQTARYLLRVREAGEYAVDLETANTSAYINISQAGKDEALHIGSIAGNSFKGRLPEAGEYAVTVYLMRNAARRNAAASYTLRVAQAR